VLGALLSSVCIFLSNIFNIQTGALIVLLLGGVFLGAALFKAAFTLRDHTKKCDAVVE
jgi:ABC-type Mn2+/Zn2+ transport system permease subunit